MKQSIFITLLTIAVAGGTTAQQTQPPISKMPDSVRKAIIGDYKMAEDRTLRLLIEGNRVYAEHVEQQQRIELTPRSATELAYEPEGIIIRYFRTSAALDSVTFTKNGKTRGAIKLKR